MNTAFAKFHVRKTDPLRDDRRISARHLEHFIGHIDADHFAFEPDDLRGDKADFSRAAAQIEDDFAFAQITRRVAAPVITLDHFLRNHLEVFGVIMDRTAKFLRSFCCSRRVTLADDGFSALRLKHF